MCIRGQNTKWSENCQQPNWFTVWKGYLNKEEKKTTMELQYKLIEIKKMYLQLNTILCMFSEETG